MTYGSIQKRIVFAEIIFENAVFEKLSPLVDVLCFLTQVTFAGIFRSTLCLLIQGFSESTIINTIDRRCRKWQKIQKGTLVTLKLQGSSSFSNTEILKVPKSYLMAFHERIEDILLKVINTK